MSNLRLIDSGDEWRVDKHYVEPELTPRPPTKTTPTFTLAQLKNWSERYCRVRSGDDSIDEERLRQLYVSDFLAWLQNEIKENVNG